MGTWLSTKKHKRLFSPSDSLLLVDGSKLSQYRWWIQMAEYVKWKGEGTAHCDLAWMKKGRRWFRIKKSRNYLEKYFGARLDGLAWCWSFISEKALWNMYTHQRCFFSLFLKTFLFVCLFCFVSRMQPLCKPAGT